MKSAYYADFIKKSPAVLWNLLLWVCTHIRWSLHIRQIARAHTTHNILCVTLSCRSAARRSHQCVRYWSSSVAS